MVFVSLRLFNVKSFFIMNIRNCMVFLRCLWMEHITRCALTATKKRVQFVVKIVDMEFAPVSVTLLLLVHRVITVPLQVVRSDQSVLGARIFHRCMYDYPVAVVCTKV